MSAATIVPCHCALPARRVLCGDGGASRSGVRARLVVAVACMCGPTCRRMSCSRSVAAVLRAGGAVPLACEPLARVSDFRSSRPGVVAVAYRSCSGVREREAQRSGSAILVRESRGSETSCGTADLRRGVGWSGVLGCAGHSYRADMQHGMPLARTTGEPVPSWELTDLWEHAGGAPTGRGSGHPEYLAHSERIV